MSESGKRSGRGGGKVVRMSDVAHRANVSLMTVSRVIREPAKVAEETRNRVFETIRETGYVPNRIAGSLASNRSTVVGLIVPSIRNSLFADTIQGTADVLRAAGLNLIIGDSGHSLLDEETLIGTLISQRVCGMILHNTTHTSRARDLIVHAGIPTVETGDFATDPIDMTVGYSNFHAAEAMTLHLADRGYRQIGFVCLPGENNDRARERRRGYASAMRRLNRRYDESLTLELPAGYESGAQAVHRLTERHPDLDALFLAGDVMAIGAVFECRRLGLDIPGRLAIAGFDDLEILHHMLPTVTSIRLPRYEIGVRSAELLLDRLSGRPIKANAVDLGFELVPRNST